MTLHSLNPLLKVIEKIAPGAPPKPNWEWHEETSRWRNPENWEESMEDPKAQEESSASEQRAQSEEESPRPQAEQQSEEDPQRAWLAAQGIKGDITLTAQPTMEKWKLTAPSGNFKADGPVDRGTQVSTVGTDGNVQQGMVIGSFISVKGRVKALVQLDSNGAVQELAEHDYFPTAKLLGHSAATVKQFLQARVRWDQEQIQADPDRSRSAEPEWDEYASNEEYEPEDLADEEEDEYEPEDLADEEEDEYEPEDLADEEEDLDFFTNLVEGESISRDQVLDMENYALAAFEPRRAPSYADPTAPEYEAVEEYQDEMYQYVNHVLANGRKAGEAEKRVIDALGSMMKPMQEPQRLYRGLDGYDQFEQNIASGKWLLDAFTSTSRSPVVAFEFAVAGPSGAGESPTFLEIETMENTWAITTSNDDGIHQEHETILDSGQVVTLKSPPKNIVFQGMPVRIIQVKIGEE